MENRQKKILVQTFAATFFVLLALALTGGKKSRSVFSFFTGSQSTIAGTDSLSAPASRYRVRQKLNDQAPSERIYKNEYRPHAAFASNYQEPQEVQHPLIASAKFISKKDQLKKAKKRKALLAKKKKSKNGLDVPFESDEDFYDDEDDSRPNANMMAAIGNTPANALSGKNGKTKEQEEEEQLNTYEFWENPIFVQEDVQAVQKLIQSYQGRKVSNTLFYTLVDDMTHDERPNLREYGLMALSATPSAKSFSELAWMKHNDTADELRSDAGKQITGYATASRVPHVVTALTTSTDKTPKASLEALSVLTETSKKYTTIRIQNDSSPEPVDTTSLNLLESRLDSALRIINEKYANSSDPKIKSEATKTVAAINDYISL